MAEPAEPNKVNETEPPRPPGRLWVGALLGAALGFGWGATYYDARAVELGDYSGVRKWVAATVLAGPIFGFCIAGILRDLNRKK